MSSALSTPSSLLRLEQPRGDIRGPMAGAGTNDEPQSVSQRLRGTLKLVLPQLTAPSRALLRHPRLATVYPEWAITNYQVARAFLPLMDTALARAQTLAATDPVAAGTAVYLERHIEEERHGVTGYGEAHLVDFPALGVDPDEARRRPLPLAIAVLAGHHYDWIVHRHPVALLGFLEVIESYPAAAWDVERLIRQSGLPRAGFEFLLLHTDLDQEHRDDLHAVLDGLPITAEQEALIGLSALRSVELISQAFWEALDQPDVSGNGRGP